MPTILPYGTWPSPITAELITGTRSASPARGSTAPTSTGPRAGRWRAGGSTLIRASRDGPAGRADAGAVQSAHPRARIWRRRIHGARRRRRRASSSPTSGSTASARRAAAAADARERRRAALRRPGARPRRAAGARGARGPSRRAASRSTRWSPCRSTGGAHEGDVLAAGHDFFAYPAAEPGRQPARLARAGTIPTCRGTAPALGRRARRRRAPAASRSRSTPAASESLVQPEWSPDGELHFVSDRSGWWNLYRVDGRGLAPRGRCSRPSSPGRSGSFGGTLVRLPRCGHRPGHRHRARAARSWRASISRPARDPRSTLPFVEFAGALLRRGARRAASRRCRRRRPAAIILLELDAGRRHGWRSRRRGTLELPTRPDRPRRAPEPSPARTGARRYALYYPPTNPDCAAPAGERPPLVVTQPRRPDRPRLARARTCRSSSGPAAASPWSTSTTRGSTGYGRAYREPARRPLGRRRRRGLRRRRAPPRRTPARPTRARLAIRGGSAGGYTTLVRADLPRPASRPAPSYYGIGDLEALARDTHKFESRYLDRLVGPWPEAAAIYRARSPIHHVDALCCPVIFFQGLDDKVVPPNQAEAMVAALRAQGPAGRLPAVRRRGPRLSRRRRDRAAPCWPSTPSSAAYSAFHSRTAPRPSDACNSHHSVRESQSGRHCPGNDADNRAMNEDVPMFRMVPGSGFSSRRASRSPGAPTGAAGLSRCSQCRLLACWPPSPRPRCAARARPRSAQRSAAVVAATYRGQVDIDRRDRTFLCPTTMAGP